MRVIRRKPQKDARPRGSTAEKRRAGNPSSGALEPQAVYDVARRHLNGLFANAALHQGHGASHVTVRTESVTHTTVRTEPVEVRAPHTAQHGAT